MAELQQRPGWRAAQLRPLAGRDARGSARVCADARSGLGRRREQSGRPLPSQCTAPAGDAAAGCAFPRQPAPPLRALPPCRPRPPDCWTIWRGWMRGEAIAGDRLDCAALAGLSLSRARNLLRHFIEQHGQPMPSARQTQRGAASVARRTQRCARVRQAGAGGGHGVIAAAPISCLRRPLRLRRFAGRARRRSGCRLPGWRFRWRRWSGTGLKRAVLTAGEVTLGVRQGGERLRLHAGGPHRSLKNLLQEQADSALAARSSAAAVVRRPTGVGGGHRSGCRSARWPRLASPGCCRGCRRGVNAVACRRQDRPGLGRAILAG